MAVRFSEPNDRIQDLQSRLEAAEAARVAAVEQVEQLLYDLSAAQHQQDPQFQEATLRSKAREEELTTTNKFLQEDLKIAVGRNEQLVDSNKVLKAEVAQKDDLIRRYAHAGRKQSGEISELETKTTG